MVVVVLVLSHAATCILSGSMCRYAIERQQSAHRGTPTNPSNRSLDQAASDLVLLRLRPLMIGVLVRIY